MKTIFTTSVATIFCTIACSQITVNQSTATPGRYDLYELSIEHSQSAYTNVWEQVSVNVNFTGPTNVAYPIDGFYFNKDTWKVRFAPPEMGSWKWSMTFTTPESAYTSDGTFKCVTSTTKGFLKRNPTNSYRLVYADDSLFNGIGIGDCIMDWSGDGNPLNDWGLDGGFRVNGQAPKEWSVSTSTYMNAYGKNGAGFNLFRWSVNNCAFNLYDTISTSGNKYAVQEGLYGDTLVYNLRQNGIRLWLTLFSWKTPFQNSSSLNSAEQAAVNNYIKYVVARYGAFVDIWELNNETKINDQWIDFTTTYLRSIDPFHRLIAENWNAYLGDDIKYTNTYFNNWKSKENIDIGDFHWYERGSEFNTDLRTSQKIIADKSGKKLVVYGPVQQSA